MTNPSSGTGITASELLLKTSPPRAPRHLLARSRLRSDSERFLDRPVTIVQAPAGFGKTSLLIQWHREYIMRGSVVAWVSLDESNDPRRLLMSLTSAIRSGCGRAAFGGRLLDGVRATDEPLEGFTAWLAEVAHLALDVVLILDEAERLPDASRDALIYLLNNLPSNLRIVVAARDGFDTVVERLGPYGQCVKVDTALLRFRLDETITLIGTHFDTSVEADACARLHDVTEGWPLGLQLALAATTHAPDPVAAIDAFASSAAGMREHFVTALLARLSDADTGFLTRISIVELLHADLCHAMTGLPDAQERLQRLMRDTPLFVVSDQHGEWFRLHAMARDALRARLADLPAQELAGMHDRAMHWLADHGMTEAAARHALASGQRETAYNLAQRCLHEAATRGQLSAVLEWLEWLPESELDRHPRLRLAAAWALALSERHQQAEVQVRKILRHAAPDDAMRYEIDLILSAAAYYADEPDRIAAFFDRWGETPPVNDAWLQQAHANRLAVRALMAGEYAKARRYEQNAPRGDASLAYRYVIRWRDYIIGLGYLFEGQVLLAERTLRPALARAEEELGRRHPFSCMLAGLLAAATFARDQIDEAAALLANRLDVLERSGTPDTVLLAYRTAARIAAARGVEHRALDLLETMYAVGIARNLPRLCVASLTEQLRLHSGRFRSETCRTLRRRVDEIVADNAAPESAIKRRNLVLLQDLAHAYTCIAEQDWRAAQQQLMRAEAGAEAMKREVVRIEIMALRALAIDRCGEKSLTLLREAMNLLEAYGVMRGVRDVHPALADWARNIETESIGTQRTDPARPARAAVHLTAEAGADRPRVAPSMVLTPKERNVLELLARHLANKEIALAMGIGQETVKWHLKNLSAKLDAGTRKQIVRRAQLLGLLRDA
ncbi:LuxR C-terminal-related transcriptional regulator [Cupriavidus basilensis]|uniref:LuxR C-terminal-related transcriptional regulator n=1 Tax=Cupriavidus basilensis TaxID=68895 RepID=UPI0020A6775B|nr:LuxR C-terminal-related transcriptional regulator [Cupriavidus basilensis]MCP3017656.1 LuxR C-terminal-related transcriptional regulator [Cupriavidus basilensis]